MGHREMAVCPYSKKNDRKHEGAKNLLFRKYGTITVGDVAFSGQIESGKSRRRSGSLLVSASA